MQVVVVDTPPIPLRDTVSGSGSQCPAVFWNWDVEPYSQQRDRVVMEALKKGHSSSSSKLGSTVTRTEDICTGSNQYTVYTLWRNWVANRRLPQWLQNAED